MSKVLKASAEIVCVHNPLAKAVCRPNPESTMEGPQEGHTFPKACWKGTSQSTKTLRLARFLEFSISTFFFFEPWAVFKASLSSDLHWAHGSQFHKAATSPLHAPPSLQYPGQGAPLHGTHHSTAVGGQSG